MSIHRFYFASLILDDFIYVFGGVNSEGYVTSCERYSYETDT